MIKVGIICEYNPFHNGHIYHLKKIKEMYPQSLIILVMSSSFTMRGNISLLNKWEKTDLALTYEVDLVIELPFLYASQSADIFSEGAIKILKTLQVDKIVFGSESNNKEQLMLLAKRQLDDPNYSFLVQKYLEKGQNYPSALALALKELTNIDIYLPNDLLALSYTREIIKQKANIDIVPIQRTNDYHDPNLNNTIASATAIRKNINSPDIKKYVPSTVYHYLQKKKINNNYFLLLKYKILSEKQNISKYNTVDEGLHNRILKYIDDVNNLEELISKIKTKRYTYNKLQRMFTQILCGLKKSDVNNLELKYIRVLGFNSNGRKYLNSIKKRITIPIITNYKKEYDHLLQLETYVDKIYALIMEDDFNYKQSPIKKD